MSFDVDLNTVHHFSAGVYAKQMLLPKGHYIVTHAHAYDHLSILASGRVTVEIDGDKGEFTAPCCINIVAGKKHEVITIEDSVWFCVHATDEVDIKNIDEVLIGG
jgi:quercetin dioxygenase-like cupin family protein